MHLIINHLTRMQPGFFCAAGIDLKSGLHVRPILDTGLRTELLSREGGPFELGATLDFGPMRFVGTTPEIEDRKFDVERLRVIEPANSEKMLAGCMQTAKSSLREIFKGDMIRVGTTLAVPENAGLYSLGCCWVEKPSLEVVTEGEPHRLRLKWYEQNYRVSVGVADIRFYQSDHRTLKLDEVLQLQQSLEQSERVLLSVGLSRPYRKSDQDRPFHYLQVNNIHAELLIRVREHQLVGPSL